MLFNSVTFLIFFVSVATVSWFLPRTPRLYLLFISSLIFYGFWRYEFIFLMMASVIIDYFIALKIYKSTYQKIKKLLLIVSVCCNLGFLLFFKYLFFFAENFSGLASLFGIEIQIDTFFYNIILPLGISFYTLSNY